MRDLIEEVDWDDILSPLNIHCAWKLFTKKFTAFIDECIPQDIPRKLISSTVELLIYETENENCGISSRYPDDYFQVRNELWILTRHLRSINWFLEPQFAERKVREQKISLLECKH